MSSSMHVVGFKPADQTWRKHKAVWDACKAADVLPPKETLDFFNSVEPDPSGVMVELGGSNGVREWSAEMQDGFEIDIAALPKHVTVVRVFMSY